MEYKMRVSDDADLFFSDISSGNCVVNLTDGDLDVQFAQEFTMHVSRDRVTGARPMEDPAPEAYLPLGVSAAVVQLGRDTVAVIGSHEGLVVVDFDGEVEAQAVTDAKAPGAEGEPGHDTVTLRHLIVSLEDPQAFVTAFGAGTGRAQSHQDTGARPA